MGWNTGFSPVTDLNKGYSLLMVQKLNVWRGVCSVVRLYTDILIEISVWGLEGAKNVLKRPISYILYPSNKMRGNFCKNFDFFLIDHLEGYTMHGTDFQCSSRSEIGQQFFLN